MARERVANPGKTAKFYRENPRSRAKHNRDNNTGGKYAHTNKYKQEHSQARRDMKIMGKGGDDVVKGKNGKLTKRESVKKNRTRGGVHKA
jgi:hypothetical protein